MDSSKQFLCDEGGMLFTNYQNRLRHVRTIHHGMKRTDKDEKRKSDVQPIAKKMNLSHTYISDIKAAITEKFNPTK